MKHIEKDLKVILALFILTITSSSLWAQGSIQEMVDKGKDLMIEGKYSEAKGVFEHAIALDPKLAETLKPYLDRVKQNLAPKKKIYDFSINPSGRWTFNGIPEDKVFSVSCEKGEWGVESLESWCKVLNVDKAFNEAEISCEHNFTGKTRKCLVYFTNDKGNGNVSDIALQIRQESEAEILKVKDGYAWRDPSKTNFLHLESTGDLVIIDLDCNTKWHVLHQPENVEVCDDNGDMSKLVIRIAPVKAMGAVTKIAMKAFGAVERDYITIATVNQDVRLTIQIEKEKLGKTKGEKNGDGSEGQSK